VTPAFVDAHSHAGVFGETDEGSSAITPEVRARDAFDPGDEVVSRVARGGVATVVVSPQDGNVVGGRAAVLKPFRAVGGAAPRGRFLGPEPMKLSIGGAALRGDREPTSRAGLVRLLRREFAAALSPAPDPAPSARLFGALDAERRRLLAELARGERPALASARSLEEVEAALALAREFPLRLAIVGALGAADAAPALAATSTRVVLPPLSVVSPREALRAAGALHAAGVRLAFSSSAPLGEPAALRFSAALAVRYGLPEEAALRALTLGGAEAAGVERMTGSLEAGKDADVAVWNGPPLALSSRLLRLYADGRVVHESERAPEKRSAETPAVAEETL
jgi:imidazolonepropionase-like amidohydrolase